jgi:hypothetical protein
MMTSAGNPDPLARFQGRVYLDSSLVGSASDGFALLHAKIRPLNLLAAP